jgi:hypothetical protein
VAGTSATEIERVFRAEYARAVAVLVRVSGDIGIAEEAVQEAFTAAAARWPSAGLPPSPAGWIITTARNRAIDRLRREATRDDRHAQAQLLYARDEPAEEAAVPDDRLRLIFTCCHPALSPSAQVALTPRRRPMTPHWPSRPTPPSRSSSGGAATNSPSPGRPYVGASSLCHLSPITGLGAEGEARTRSGSRFWFPACERQAVPTVISARSG